MRRAVLSAPGVFEIEDAPTPAPGAGEVLLRIHAVGVCGSDLHMFKEGSIGGITIADAGGPFVPGHECMGTIAEVGAGVDRARIGHRVFVEPAVNCTRCRWCLAGRPNICPHHTFLGLPPREGCLTEYMVHPARLCEPLPDEIDDDAGTLLEPLAIAVHSLDRVAFVRGHDTDAQLPATMQGRSDPEAKQDFQGLYRVPGQTVVVIGCGPMGLTHVLLLARGGFAPIIATDVLDYRLVAARRLGATHTFNPTRDDVPAAVAELTDGHGADFVFECAGQPETFEQMAELAAPGARIGIVGIPAEDVLACRHSVARRKELDLLMIRRANLTAERALGAARQDQKLLASLATHHWPLEAVADAFTTAAEYRDGVIKAIVNP